MREFKRQVQAVRMELETRLGMMPASDDPARVCFVRASSLENVCLVVKQGKESTYREANLGTSTQLKSGTRATMRGSKLSLA